MTFEVPTKEQLISMEICIKHKPIHYSYLKLFVSVFQLSHDYLQELLLSLTQVLFCRISKLLYYIFVFTIFLSYSTYFSHLLTPGRSYKSSCVHGQSVCAQMAN